VWNCDRIPYGAESNDAMASKKLPSRREEGLRPDRIKQLRVLLGLNTEGEGVWLIKDSSHTSQQGESAD
jgi:hypothetical protein